jgi:gamma-butyrobetaine dioxygenase
VVKGGESIFLDSFMVVEKFQQEFPKYFDILTKIPATFQKIHFHRSRPVCMIFKRPHIVLNNRGQVMAVNWAPPFEGPLSLDLTQVFTHSPLETFI